MMRTAAVDSAEELRSASLRKLAALPRELREATVVPLEARVRRKVDRVTAPIIEKASRTRFFANLHDLGSRCCWL